LPTTLHALREKLKLKNKEKQTALPIKHGIAKKMQQGPRLKEIIQEHFPKLAKIELCNHQTVDELFNCIECQPFKDLNSFVTE
jgi:hypothetical protein